MDFCLQNGKFIYKQGKMGARAGISLTKRDFQITNEKREGEGGFLDYKRDFRFTIHHKVIPNYGQYISECELSRKYTFYIVIFTIIEV